MNIRFNAALLFLTCFICAPVPASGTISGTVDGTDGAVRYEISDIDYDYKAYDDAGTPCFTGRLSYKVRLWGANYFIALKSLPFQNDESDVTYSLLTPYELEEDNPYTCVAYEEVYPGTCFCLRIPFLGGYVFSSLFSSTDFLSDKDRDDYLASVSASPAVADYGISAIPNGVIVNKTDGVFGDISLLSVSGVVLKRVCYVQGPVCFDNIPAGVYLLSITADSNRDIIKILIK